MSFPGFRRPNANFYRLPNDWFDLWQAVRTELGRQRVLGVLKVTEYVIKWTWGYQNFDRPLRLTWLDFQRGRREGGRRLDLGTGLSSRSLQAALVLAVTVGVLEKHEASTGEATYLPHLRTQDNEPPGFLPGSNAVAQFGFSPPTANYFLVPAGWTDLSSDVRSETLLLTMAYLFRHTWGWHGSRHEPCWLSEEEIAQGRTFQTQERGEQRYDQGTAYSPRAVREALKEGETRRWLVWRWHGGQRQHALYLQGMIAADDVHFLGWQGSVSPATVEPDLPDLPPSETASSRPPTGVKRHASSARGAGAAPERKADMERSKAAVEQSKARQGTKYSAPYMEETDTPFQTPTADTNAAALSSLATPNANVITAALSPTPIPDPRASTPPAALPPALQGQVRRLRFRGKGPLGELRAAYAKDPQRISRWLEHLVATRADDPQVGGFLLQVVVREQAPAPTCITANEQSCSFCLGAGVLHLQVAADDPQHCLRIPCPRCQTASGSL